MANTVTKEAKPLRCEQKTHHKTDRSAGVTSNYKNGLVNRFTVSVSPLWRSGGGEEKGEEGREEGEMGAGGWRGDKNWGKMGGRENLRARSSRRSEKGLGDTGLRGEVRWREGERPVACPSPYFLQQMCYIITKKNIV